MSKSEKVESLLILNKNTQVSITDKHQSNQYQSLILDQGPQSLCGSDKSKNTINHRKSMQLRPPAKKRGNMLQPQQNRLFPLN